MLFASSMDCTQAAQELSSALEQALKCQTETEAWSVIAPVMEKWWEFGAEDSEPRNVVRAYMNATYPDELGQCYVVDREHFKIPFV
jgi:hypothetical protein